MVKKKIKSKEEKKNNKNMNNTDIIGGVSPLKARQSSRGGKRAGQATSTSKRRGGFAKSTGKLGGGGRNVGGYNVNTRFTTSAPWTPPASGGTTYVPSPKKPYNYDEDGNMKVDPTATKTWTDPVKGGTSTEKTEKARSSYQDSYDAMEDKDGGKYNSRNDKTYTSFEEYEAEAIKFNKENPDHKEYETKTVTKEGKPGFWTYKDENGNKISEKEYSKYKNKK